MPCRRDKYHRGFAGSHRNSRPARLRSWGLFARKYARDILAHGARALSDFRFQPCVLADFRLLFHVLDGIDHFLRGDVIFAPATEQREREEGDDEGFHVIIS